MFSQKHVDPSKQQNNKQRPVSSAFWYLQWTTMGPEKGRLTTLTFLRNLSMPMGEKGTPKSGQLVKWSWVTSLGVLAASLACYMETQTQAGTRLTVLTTSEDTTDTGPGARFQQEPLSKGQSLLLNDLDTVPVPQIYSVVTWNFKSTKSLDLF